MMKFYYNFVIIIILILTVSIVYMNSLLTMYIRAEGKLFNFVAVGDLDCTSNSNQTIYNIMEILQKVLFFHIHIIHSPWVQLENY